MSEEVGGESNAQSQNIQTEKTAVSVVEEARQINAELRKSIEENKAILQNLERIKAEEILKGNTEAGIPAPEKKEETPQEYAKRMVGGK